MVRKLYNFELVHIGINTNSEQDSENLSNRLAFLFNLKIRQGTKSNFSGEIFECLKSNYLGKNGHIALGVHNLEGAMKELEQKGVTFNMDTIQYNVDGKVKNIYINEEFEGFAIHIMELK